MPAEQSIPRNADDESPWNESPLQCGGLFHQGIQASFQEVQPAQKRRSDFHGEKRWAMPVVGADFDQVFLRRENHIGGRRRRQFLQFPEIRGTIMMVIWKCLKSSGTGSQRVYSATKA